MKTQIDKGNDNVQYSDDENTIQIQIGQAFVRRVLELLGAVVAIGSMFLAYHWLL